MAVTPGQQGVTRVPEDLPKAWIPKNHELFHLTGPPGKQCNPHFFSFPQEDLPSSQRQQASVVHTFPLEKTELSGRWGGCSGQGAQEGIVEGGARVVCLHARLPGCFLGEVVCVHLGSSCKDEEMAMNPALPKVQN